MKLNQYNEKTKENLELKQENATLVIEINHLKKIIIERETTMKDFNMKIISLQSEINRLLPLLISFF